MENKARGLMKRIGAGAVGAVALASAGCASLDIKVDSLKFGESIELPTLDYYVKEAKQKAEKEAEKRKEEEIAQRLGVPRKDWINLGNGYYTDRDAEWDIRTMAGIMDGSMKIRGYYNDNESLVSIRGRLPYTPHIDKKVLDIICKRADRNPKDNFVDSRESIALIEEAQKIYFDSLKGRK